MKNISDKQLRAYFLGTLTEAEAEILEMECAADAGLTERSQLVEGELADDYVRRNLSADEAALFEANYLTTEARRAKLRVAKGLWQIAREEKPARAAAAATGFNWRTFFSGNALKLVCGALLLIVAYCATVFYLRNTSVENRQVAEIKVSNSPAEPANPLIENPALEMQAPVISTTENPAAANREVNRSVNAPPKNQTAQKNPSAPKINGQNQSAFAVFALLPGALRDAGEQFITVAPATKNLGLRLKLPEDSGSYRIYRAVVKTPEGDTVFAAPNLKLTNLTIPAEKLENRTYLIFLEGKNAAGEFESVAEYSFRVRR